MANLSDGDTQQAFRSASGDAVGFVCWLLACLTSQQQASVSQGRICSDNFTCCHTEIEAADQTFYLTQSQYTDTGLTSPSADPITPGTWQGSHWSANFWVTGMTWPQKKSWRKRDSNPGSYALEADALTTRPMRRYAVGSGLTLARPLPPTLYKFHCDHFHSQQTNQGQPNGHHPPVSEGPHHPLEHTQD